MNYVNGSAAVLPESSLATPPLFHNQQSQSIRSTLTVPDKLVAALYEKLPDDAIQPHPTKAYLSTIKTIFVIERLNAVFGMGGWNYTTRIVERETLPATEKQGPRAMIVMKVVLKVPAYGIRIEQYGGSENEDAGHAYQGAVTDALGKIASYLGIGIDVYKGGGPTKANPRGRAVPPRPLPAAPIDAGGHAVGTQAAADYVAQQKIAELSGEKQAAETSTSWNREDMRRSFAAIRERLGEFDYLGVLEKFGVKKAEDFRKRDVARECYRQLLALSNSKREVA